MKLLGELDRYYELYLYKRDPSIPATRIIYKTENEVNLAKIELKKKYVYCETFIFLTVDEWKAQGFKNKKPKIREIRFKLDSEGVLQGWSE